MPKGFFDLLPRIAGHPLAVVAYLCLIVGWLIWWLRRKQSDVFLQALAKISKEERVNFCRQSGFKYEELAQLPTKDRLSLLTRRYVLYAVLATIIAVLLFGLTCVLVVREKNADLHTAIDKIEEDRKGLQQKLDNEQRNEMIFATGVKGVAESASVATNFVHDPELSRVAIKLTQLVANFLFRYGDQQSDDITFELRLAKATAANVLGHYSEALGLLPESEIENSANQAQQKSEQAFLLLAARGDAFKGQGKWESAINDYRRALVFHPNHLGVLFQIASVFSQEGNTGEAIKGYGLLIDQVTNRSILPNEAMLILGALVNRSQIFHGTKQYTNALRDWSAAISLLVSFSPTNTSNDFVLGFVFCQRANEYADLEKVPEETSDLDKSIEILTHVSTGLTDNHSKNVLYLVLYNRALVARDQGRYVEAIGYCERALETLRQLDQKDPVTTAQIFCCRGNSNRALGQTNGAMEDFEKAEYELAKTNLLPSGGLATAFNSCGLANEGFENYALAERDFIRAIATYQKLSENDTEFSTNDYAGNLLNLLRLQIKNHQYSAAEQNCHKVLELKPAEKYMQDANVILQFLASNSQK